MLNVVAVIQPKPELFEKCRGMVLEIIDKTLAEPGCLRFELYENAKNCELILVERWINQQALDFHYEQPYVTDIFTFYENALACSPRIYKLAMVS